MKAKLEKLLNQVQIYLLTLLGGIKRKAFDLLGSRLYEAELRNEKERALTKDLTDKVFALERIKEALLEENKKLAEAFGRAQNESKRLSEIIEGLSGIEREKKTLLESLRHLETINNRQAADLQHARQKEQSMWAELQDEKSGYQTLDATNRHLQALLKQQTKELFDQGPGMYMIHFNEVAGASKSFRIPLKLQKKITTILTDKQKTKLRTQAKKKV